MASFQAKIVSKMSRTRENKNYRFFPFLPDTLLNISKKLRRNSKNKKIPLWLHFKPKSVERE